MLKVVRSICFIKVSSDEIIHEFCTIFFSKLLFMCSPKEIKIPESMESMFNNNFLNDPINTNSFLKFQNKVSSIKYESNKQNDCLLYNNIGMNKFFLFNSNEVIQCFDYNYLLSKKYKYFKLESISQSGKFLFFINIHDSRGIENMKTIIDDIKSVKYSENVNNDSIHKIVNIGLLIKQTNDFLLSLVESDILLSIKETFNFDYFIEFNIDDIEGGIYELLNIL